MPRPRQYANATERQAAHRERTVKVDRAALTALLEAIAAAAEAGDPEARQVRTSDPNALLRNLAQMFRDRNP